MTAADFRDRLLAGLGGPWPDPPPLKPQIRETTQHAGYRIEKLTYEAESDDPIPALLLVPDGVTSANPAPGICVWHQHAGQWHLGKTEPAGLAGDPMHHTGAALASGAVNLPSPVGIRLDARRALAPNEAAWFPARVQSARGE